MSTWPDAWRETTLEQAGIPVTQFALDMLNLWQKSTPTDRWTNNPLGIPSHGFDVPKAFNTPYGAFPTMPGFRKAFARAVHMGSGKPLFTALSAQDKPSAVWRAIHALNWPGNLTETDYPAKILDMVDTGQAATLTKTAAADRKSVGTTDAQTDVHAMIRAQGQALHHAVNNIGNAADAIGYVLKRMAGNG